MPKSKRHDDSASSPTNFRESALAAIANGQRLTDDAQVLLDFERFPSAFAVSILAQEEYAKALILTLVDSGGLPWSVQVRDALRDHICKHLGSVILDFVCPEFDEWQRRYSTKRTTPDPWELPPSVVDAVHVMVHERIPRRGPSDWLDDDEKVDASVRKVAKGWLDHKKQGALYVDIHQDGSVRSEPKRIGETEARKEYDRAVRIGSELSPHDGVPGPSTKIEMRRLLLLFKLLTGAMPVEQFHVEWH